MINQNSEITEVIIRHLQGSATEAEELQLKHWLGQSAENASFYSDYRNVWEKSKIKQSDFSPNVDEAWRKVRSKAILNESASLTDAPVVKINNYNNIWKIAAAIFFIVGLGFVVLKQLQPDQIIEVVAYENMEVKLPDGSKVSLNKNSRLKYPEEFDDSRDVQLEGEAFFEVQRDTTKPFRVQGKLTTTEVLGTSFKVRAIPGENFEETTVVTGKVSFRKKQSDDNVILTPGQKGFLEKEGKVTLEKIETANVLSWKTKELLFEDVPVQQVAEDLERYFGKEVSVSGDVALQKFTGKFNNPTIEQVLNVIAVSTDSRLVKEDSTYKLIK